MRVQKILVLLPLAATALLAGCGGDKTVSQRCDEHTVYLDARERERVVAPDGLTQLDPEREMALPEPSSQQPRPADAPCLDLPPSVLGPEEAPED